MLVHGGISPVVTGFGGFPLHSSSVGCLLLEMGHDWCPLSQPTGAQPGAGLGKQMGAGGSGSLNGSLAGDKSLSAGDGANIVILLLVLLLLFSVLLVLLRILLM